MARATKKGSNYRTVEQRFGPGAKLPGQRRGGIPVEEMGGKYQRKLTGKEERQVVGERMRYVKDEMATRRPRP
jgi:hypothetical protein